MGYGPTEVTQEYINKFGDPKTWSPDIVKAFQQGVPAHTIGRTSQFSIGEMPSGWSTGGYAKNNPDLLPFFQSSPESQAQYGSFENFLVNHYGMYGAKEGRTWYTDPETKYQVPEFSYPDIQVPDYSGYIAAQQANMNALSSQLSNLANPVQQESSKALDESAAKKTANKKRRILTSSQGITDDLTAPSGKKKLLG